ncbi:CopG family transcriptional regulator [Methyloraptor flagellatus]|uniref:CopG family transcriptional regulator n=1 Tax=Methyloraptor flagellatus TaxID=3162530 RepID=A0AAU7XGV1_9HYPH
MSEISRKTDDTEKITINVGYVDLGRIDLLVSEGFYSNRSDFIRTAIRNHLNSHRDVLDRSLERRTLDLGLREISRAELEAARDRGTPLHIRVVGLARFSPDVTPDLAAAAIGTITVLGALQAPPAIRSAIADRIR